MSDMITPLLPQKSVKSPMLLEVPLQDGMRLFVGAVGRLTAQRPGNGGVRIWSYESRQAAAAEVSTAMPKSLPLETKFLTNSKVRAH
jgi:hypothetical protein